MSLSVVTSSSDDEDGDGEVDTVSFRDGATRSISRGVRLLDMLFHL